MVIKFTKSRKLPRHCFDIVCVRYASWGVDFLKYDNCNVPSDLIGKPIPRYTAMSKALNATGRPIFFAMCEWGVASPSLRCYAWRHGWL